MTVPNENTVNSFTLTSTGQTLNLDYTFLDETHVLVLLNQSETPLVLNSDYTVTVPTLGQNGSIKMDVATGVATDNILVERCPPCTQLTVFRQNDSFPAKVNERTHDQGYMLACKAIAAIFGSEAVAIRYPRFEAGNGVSAITPVVSDRKAGGVGTLAGFDGTSGAITVFSKGSLNLALLLSNDSFMTAPDGVNGYTSSAIRTFLDRMIAALDLNTSGTFKAYTGARFLNGYGAVVAATTQKEADEILDEVMRIVVDIDIPDLGDRVTDLETAAGNFVQLSHIDILDKTTTGAFSGSQDLTQAPFNLPSTAITAWIRVTLLTRSGGIAGDLISNIAITAPFNMGDVARTVAGDENGADTAQDRDTFPLDVSSGKTIAFSGTINANITAASLVCKLELMGYN